MRSATRVALLLFALSLVVRAGVFLSVSPLRAVFDEKSYLDRSTAVAEILDATARGEAPPARAFQRVYAEGVWPPLFPLLVGAGLFLSTPDADHARVWVLLLSAATTPVVFFITLQIAGPRRRRAGVAGGLIHAFYPSFVAYGHLLWSETLFILLLLLAVLAACKAGRAASVRRAALFSALCGAALGLGVLTRLIGLAPLAVVPLWMAAALRDRRRVIGPLLTLSVAAVVIAPWQAVLYSNEGGMTALSTASGYNLLKLNSDFTSKAKLRATIAAYAAAHDLRENEAGTELAMAAIANDVPRFLARSWLRIRSMGSVDEFLLRHVMQVHYPPLGAAALYAFFFLLLLSFLGLVTLAAAGTYSIWRGDVGREAAAAQMALLLALWVGCGFAPALTIGNSRMGLPLLALLLPLAGIGATCVRDAPRAAHVGFAVFALLNLLNITTLPAARGAAQRSAGYVSSFYLDVRDPFGYLRPAESATLDCIKLRAGEEAPDRIAIGLDDANYRFLEFREREILWDTSVQRSQVFDVVGEHASAPLELILAPERSGQTVRLEPIRRENLRVYQPTGIEGVAIRWCGVRSSHQGREF